eukprot:8327868-Prorocentrum_lima.AAC.1
MTSSLVGSEMCIRDSSTLLTCADCGTVADNIGFYFRISHTKEELQGSQPVSYTHLTLPTICSV